LLEESTGPRASRRGQAGYGVLHALLDRWLRGQGPVHTTELMATVGCSYPTAAGALADLAGVVRRHRDRRVELGAFPVQAWGRYRSMAEEVRGTLRYADRSGKPRSTAQLAARLGRLRRDDLAVGGVFGALHHLPRLDIVGSATLCVTLHDPHGSAPADFVERLDPALAPTKDALEPALLIVHHQRLRRFLAEPGAQGHAWADPVDCLLDLHEAGLDGLADEFLRGMASRAAAKP